MDAQYEQTEEIDPETGKTKSKYAYSDEVRSKISDLRSKIGDSGTEFSSAEIKLLQQPTLLVDGEAGVGKSHLLANEVETHIKNGNPLFIPVRILDHGDRPEQGCTIWI